jgi:hypothetical protein
MNEIQEKPYKETEWDLDPIWQQQKHEKRGNGERKESNKGKGFMVLEPLSEKVFKFLGLAHL